MSQNEEQAHLADLVDQLEQEAMVLDGGGDSSGVHLLFRTVHNLKSLSAYLGLKELAGAFHIVEDGLDKVRRGKEPWTADWSDRVFASIDLARATLGGDAHAAPAPRAQAVAATPLDAWGMPLDADQGARVADALLQGLGLYRIEKLFKRGLSREAFQGLPVMEDVAEQGTLIAVHPDWDGYAAGPAEQVVKILFASASSHEQLSRIFFDPMLELQAPQPAAGPEEEAIRCLVIEDDATTGAVLGKIVGRHGACMVASRARQGHAAFLKAWERAEPYHILFLDLHLPDLSGLAILTAVRRFESERLVPRNRRCMVIITTASERLDDIRSALLLDADGYLLKPVNAEAIEEKITLIKETWLREN